MNDTPAYLSLSVSVPPCDNACNTYPYVEGERIDSNEVNLESQAPSTPQLYTPPRTSSFVSWCGVGQSSDQERAWGQCIRARSQPPISFEVMDAKLRGRLGRAAVCARHNGDVFPLVSHWPPILPARPPRPLAGTSSPCHVYPRGRCVYPERSRHVDALMPCCVSTEPLRQ